MRVIIADIFGSCHMYVSMYVQDKVVQRHETLTHVSR